MSAQYAEISAVSEERWLKQYYFIRGAFSVLWVALALTGRRDRCRFAHHLSGVGCFGELCRRGAERGSWAKSHTGHQRFRQRRNGGGRGRVVAIRHE